jgi:AMMECR1 domain-containing protein
VTLHHNEALRGCIGSLQAYRSLIEDISGNAFSAAFQDPRFAPLEEHELAG